MALDPAAIQAALAAKQGAPAPAPSSPIGAAVAGGMGETPLLKLIELLSAVAELGGGGGMAAPPPSV